MTPVDYSTPFAVFKEWFQQATAEPKIADATAMTLATAAANGTPSARMVLLKQWDKRGFVFYTNNSSRKGSELKVNPHVALCLYWPALGKQVRIEGDAEPVSDAEADAYFDSRPRDSQLGAWASLQSKPMPSREILMEQFAQQKNRYADYAIPRPPHWGGWRVIPSMIEFWQEGESRLHDRQCYRKHENGWLVEQLYP